MQNKNLGFNKDNIGYFQFSYGMPREILKKDLSNNPDIVSVTIANNPFSGMGTAFGSVLTGKGKRKVMMVLFQHSLC